ALLLFGRRHRGYPRGAREADGASSDGVALDDPPAQRYSAQEHSSLFPRCWPSRSRGVPCEPLDAPENLPKEVPRQVAIGQLQRAGSWTRGERRSASNPVSRRARLKYWTLTGATRAAIYVST